MKIIVTALALALLLAACSVNQADYTEGCWITHANDIKLNPAVPLPREGEPLALNPGASYQTWCAREISESSIGNIITEDQRTIRIDSMPRDAELHVYPNERDSVYVGQPAASSEEVWNSLQKASSTSAVRMLMIQIESALLAAAVVVIVILAVVVRHRRSQSENNQNTDTDVTPF